MFNWEKFKKGEIAVHCDTKEKAINFLKECDTQGVKWKCGGDLKSLTKWDFHERKTVYGCCDGDANLYYGTDIYYVKHDIPIIKWNIKEDNIEKTFREVIADIKEGEVWECGHILITKSNDGIELKGMSSCSSYFTDDNKIFKLQRKQYTFEEAFKAYEEGKEIQSISSDKIYQKERDYLFASYEISKKWYINN